MEQLVQASSGFGPVHSKIKLIDPTKTAVQQSQKNVSKTFTIDVPLKLAESNQSGERQWKGYRDYVSSQSMLQNYTNFKRSHAPARLLQWIDGAWVELSDEVLLKARSAFLDGRPMVEIHVDGNDCIFDFFRMLLVDVGSGLQRSIGWIDVRGDCFFPKFFVDESLLDDDDDNYNDAGVDAAAACDETPKIEIEIKVDTATNYDNNNNNNRSASKRKREREVEDTADSSCNYSESGNAKRQCLVDTATATWPKARLMSEGERSYSVVKELFMNGMKTVDPGVQITSVHQIMRTGTMEKARWEVFKKHMEGTKEARGLSHTVFAWHGASKKEVLDIVAHGFGSPTKVPESQAHGVGVYLSPARLPHTSDMLAEVDGNGEKHVVLCRVILGNVEKVQAGSQQCCPSSVNFDTGVDDLDNPKWFVVWTSNMNTHILPECVVSYKCSDHPQGPTGRAEFMKWIPNGSSSVVAKLFSKLGSSVPISKLEELKVLCMTYKAGKMAKDVFIKQLRSLVGNGLLFSAISEIQGSN